MTKVTDADREAAVKHYRSVGRRALAGGITAGVFDSDALVQQFAHHREEATRELVEALEKITAMGENCSQWSNHCDLWQDMQKEADQALAKHTGGK